MPQACAGNRASHISAGIFRAADSARYRALKSKTGVGHARRFRGKCASARNASDAKGTICAAIVTLGHIVTEPGFETLKKGKMKTQAKASPYLRLPVGGIAAILVSGIAVASLGISAQGSNGVVAPTEVPEAAAVPALAASATRSYRCAGCGVIESTREINGPDEKPGIVAPSRIAAGKRGEMEAKPLRNHEITIRLHDGSMRVITDAKPAKWRHGEAVTIIAGADL